MRSADREIRTYLIDVLGRAKNTVDYLYESSGYENGLFLVMSDEFTAAEGRVGSLLLEDRWADDKARNDMLRLVRRCQDTFEIAGMPFLERDASELLTMVQTLYSEG